MEMISKILFRSFCNFAFLEMISKKNNYFSDAALINAAKDSSGNPGLLLNSG